MLSQIRLSVPPGPLDISLVTSDVAYPAPVAGGMHPIAWSPARRRSPGLEK